MRFIPPKKLKALIEARDNGDERAAEILNKYMENDPDMDAIERLLSKYYGLPSDNGTPEQTQEQIPEAVHEAVASGPQEQESMEALTEDELGSLAVPQEQEPAEEPQAEEEVIEEEASSEEIPPEEQPAQEEEESFDDIELEMDGLIDDDEFDDESFSDFLKAKKRNALRASKGADYFRAFDEGHRGRYLAQKKEKYARGFDGRLGKIERLNRDNVAAIASYLQRASDSPDDEFELNQDAISGAYGGIVDNDIAMGAFGRSWDDNDNIIMTDILVDLIGKYGKKNVIAALNVISDDNRAWYDNAKQRIGASIEHYSKSLDSLLK